MNTNEQHPPALADHIEETIMIHGVSEAMQIFDYVPENIIIGITTSLLASLRPADYDADLDIGTSSISV